MTIEHHIIDNIVMNVPEWFADPEFMAAIDNPSLGIATWHARGAQLGDYSDVFLFVDPSLTGEGSEEGDIPDRYWDQVIDACLAHCRSPGFHESRPHILVRLTNLQE